MTDLLIPTPTRRAGQPHAGRRLVPSAALAGLLAAGWVLLACAVLALAGWYASDAGSHGDTRAALRVAADGWLLAHGAHLALPAATITVAPLALTGLSVYAAFRLARWVAQRSAITDLGTGMVGAVVFAGAYALVALTVAVLAGLPQARPNLLLAVLGGFAIALVGSVAGMFTGTGLIRDRLPEWLQAVASGAMATVVAMVVAGTLVVSVTLVSDLGSAANVLSRLHTGLAGGLLYIVVVAAVLPNAALLATAYLLGPGFVVGTGTMVSPSAVVLGPLPAFPLVAALPDAGPTPWWTTVLLAVPVLAGAVAAVVMLRRHPAPSYESAAVRGLLAGLLGALVLSVLVVFAGGSAGPGRMADLGAPWLATTGAALVSLGIGGLTGGLLTTWWQRRR